MLDTEEGRSIDMDSKGNRMDIPRLRGILEERPAAEFASRSSKIEETASEESEKIIAVGVRTDRQGNMDLVCSKQMGLL